MRTSTPSWLPIMPNVVFDASTVVGAALKINSIPDQAVLLARSRETICMSHAVEDEIRDVLARPKFLAAVTKERRDEIIAILVSAAVRFAPRERVIDCRDAKDNKYLELALAADAATIVSSDGDLLALDPWRGRRDLTPPRSRQVWDETEQAGP